MRIRLHYADSMRDLPVGGDAAEYAAIPHSVVFDGEIDITDVRSFSAMPGPNPLTIAEFCFDIFNRHDSPSQHEALDRLEIRSLSVGDIVEFVDEGMFMVCMPFGFERVEVFA